MIERNLQKVWGQLRGQRPQIKDFLEDVRIKGLRGITDLRVPLNYPVTVLAGPNACGKSTVLFSLACGYTVTGAGVKENVPSTVFPRFAPRQELIPQDSNLETSFEYNYLVDGQRRFMRWSRTKKGWNRSFGGAKGASQPKREIYIRTLATLSNPSEVRSFLQMGRQKLSMRDIDSSLLAFAHRILPFQYQQLSAIAHRTKEMLFARRSSVSAFEQDAPNYSEFHMSAGERAVLRLSRDLSRLEGALVLIDEVETGLHPFIQQQLMYELQQLALKNRLQIVVTSHSPVIIESVPEEGRVFLERIPDSSNVQVKPPYRDIIQRALYGSSRKKLSVLCEDDVAEGLILGIFDVLNVKLQTVPSDIVIGRDTGKEEFPGHVKALGTFDLLPSFVFVLDGDGRHLEMKIKEEANKLKRVSPRLLFLPGTKAPEVWIWECITKQCEEYAKAFGVTRTALDEQVRRLTSLFDATSDKDRLKDRFYTLCSDFLNREQCEVSRIVGRVEAGRGDLFEVAQALESAVQDWRSQKDL